MSKLVRARRIIEKYDITKQTLFNWAAAGKITAYRPSKRTVLFDPDEVEAFIRRQVLPTVPTEPKQ